MCLVKTGKCKNTESGEPRFYVIAPYNKSFFTRAKNLGGIWSMFNWGQFGGQPAWIFPAAVEDDARKLCIDIYGLDGIATVEIIEPAIDSKVTEIKTRIADLKAKLAEAEAELENVTRA